MNLIRLNKARFTDPFDHLDSFQREVNRLVSSSFGALGNLASSDTWSPSLDLSQDDDNFVVALDAPGLSKEAFHVSLEDGVLTISGERRFPEVKEEDNVLRRERFSGSFSRSLTLPAAVDSEKVSAAYTDGVLTITLPRSEAAKPRQIQIK